MPPPSLFWDASVQRYRSATGQFVSQTAIRDAVEAVTRESATAMRGLATQLKGGDITIGQFQTRMADEIKSLHTATAAAAHGGWGQMSQADWGFVGNPIIRPQYAYLNSMVADIASGKQPLDGTLEARAELYAHAGRQTYEAMRARDSVAAGFELCANRLAPAEHCPGCLAATSMGWVPIERMPPPGSRDCRVRCHCTLEFRRLAA